MDEDHGNWIYSSRTFWRRRTGFHINELAYALLKNVMTKMRLSYMTRTKNISLIGLSLFGYETNFFFGQQI